MSRLSTLLSTALLAAASAGMAQARLVYDAFTQPLWTAESSKNVSVFEQGQRLKVEFTRQAAGDVFSGGYFSTCRLTGDFDIQTDYAVPLYPTRNGVRVGLMLNTSPTNGVWRDGSWVAVERLSTPEGRSFLGADFHNYGSGGSTELDTAETTGKLRLVRQGQVLEALAWDAAQGSWFLLNRTESFTASPVHLGLTAWSHDAHFGHVAVHTSFDNAVINSGNCLP